MNQNNDDNYGYQEEDYGQDYDEGQQEDYAAEEGYAEETYDDSQLPVQEGRSFFQRFASLIIFGGIGIFALVMAYINFGHLLFGPDENAPQVTADQLLNPDQSTVIQDVVPPPPADTPIIPTADTSGVPEMNAMGVSPAAPVTGATDGGMALSPAAPPANPEDPWAEVAATPPAAPEAVEPPPVAAAPTAPALPEVGTNAPAATASVGEPVAVAPAEAEKLLEVQKKLSEAEATRAEQEATIAELQNRLAEAEAKAVAKPAAPAPSAAEAAPKPAPKPKPAKPATPKAVTSWELRSASDGQAWITRRGDNQLFRVTVGDEIPGVGRVTSIGEQGGRWVVVGTEGQIRQ